MNGRYRTIVCDPPWRYQNNRGTPTNSSRGRTATLAEGNYPTMSIPEICALPVKALADTPSALYLWVTNPMLFEARSVVESWGFRYITLLTWVKTGGAGLGFHFRGHTEHVLYAIRGEQVIPPHLRESNVIVAPRRGHSQKPEAFYDLVERVSPPPYVELFSRNHQRLGWSTWGNQAHNTAGFEVPA